MKAFLSHSSRDKALVTSVAEEIGGASVELDADTFDRGILNVAAIEKALKRSSLFVLFLSEEAIQSSAVNLEVALAQELQSRGMIEKFFVFCIDELSFDKIPAEWKKFNFVRKAVSPQTIGRLIKNELLVTRGRDSKSATPFVGRQSELGEAKNRLMDPDQPPAKALFVSGPPGLGRRTFSRKLYSDVYPSVGKVFPQIHLDRTDGLEEIFRKLLDILTPISTLAAYRAHITSFAIANDARKAELIAAQINRLLDGREAVFVHDDGGVLNDDGGFHQHFVGILASVNSYPHPALTFIARRMVPHGLRRANSFAAYCPLSAMANGEIKQLIGLMLRGANIAYSPEELDQLVELSDGHPLNVAFIVEAVRQYTLPVFLADTTGLRQWKHNRAAEFIRQIQFSDGECRILGALRDFRVLDFSTIADLLNGDTVTASKSVANLIDLHMLEPAGNAYALSAPVRPAVERDRRFESTGKERQALLRTLANMLKSDGATDVSTSMINTSILAALEADEELPELFSALLLPSHFVWLARRKYDDRKYEEALELARHAVASVSRLSHSGAIEACRLVCLSAARLGNEEAFQGGINAIRNYTTDSWGKSSLEFLLGFNHRLKGNLPLAERNFRTAYDHSPGNFWAARELASVCSKRGDAAGAEKFARRAYEVAPDSPYVLDVLLKVLINLPADRQQDVGPEIEHLLERFGKIGDQDSHSFYTTRMAEYSLRRGDLNAAIKHIDEATKKSPSLFDVQAIRARVYLERGSNVIAAEAIQKMEKLVDKNSAGERRTNMRPFLEIRSSYFAATGQFEEAKKLYKDRTIFTDQEAAEALKQIDIEQAYRRRT
ncbi:MAG: tetratricopeptide repeat protein [Proteobacteria bacterium]|nr:MAG: tetratricopeptide repeat protein [Pseudomonadota bacterium]